MKTKEDFTTSFMGYGQITVPKGIRVSNLTALGLDPNYHFVDQFDWVKRDYPSISNILIHDLTYYGLNVPKEFIEP